MNPAITWYIVLAAIIWWWLWYFVFYLRYKHRDTIDQLRSNLKEANKEIQDLTAELDEITAQNTILKQKTAELLDRNDDLSDVVAELSKYYVHIKKASAKSDELSKFLQEPNEDVEDQIKKFSRWKKENDSDDKIFF